MLFNVMVFQVFWLIFMVFQGIFMASHGFWLVFMIFKSISRVVHVFNLTIVNDAIFSLKQQDYLMRLFLIVANHRSNNAMFALYRSSLLNIMQRIGRPLKFPSECSAFEMRANIVLSSHNCQRLTRALKRCGKKQTAHLTKRPKRST